MLHKDIHGIAIVVYPLLHSVSSKAIAPYPSRYKVFCLTLLPTLTVQEIEKSRNDEEMVGYCLVH